MVIDRAGLVPARGLELPAPRWAGARRRGGRRAAGVYEQPASAWDRELLLHRGQHRARGVLRLLCGDRELRGVLVTGNGQYEDLWPLADLEAT